MRGGEAGRVPDPLPESWIVLNHTLGVHPQMSGKAAFEAFIAIEPALSRVFETGIALLDRADR